MYVCFSVRSSGASFSDQSGGGGRESNLMLLPFMIQVIKFTIFVNVRFNVCYAHFR